MKFTSITKVLAYVILNTYPFLHLFIAVLEIENTLLNLVGKLLQLFLFSLFFLLIKAFTTKELSLLTLKLTIIL